MNRKLRVALLASLLLVSTVAGGLGPAAMASTATAASTPSECSVDDSAQYGFISGIKSALGLQPAYGEVVECTEQIQQQAAEDNQTATDLYSSARQAKRSWESTNTIAQNSLETVQTAAFAKGQAAAAEAMDSGVSRSEAVQTGRQVAIDFVTQKQINYAQRYESTAHTLKELSFRAANESGVSNTLIGIQNERTTYDYSNIHSSEPRSFTLANGSSLSLPFLNHDGSFPVIWAETFAHRDEPDYSQSQIRVESTNGQSSFTFFNTTDTGSVMAEFDSTAQLAADNVEAWVNGTYDPYQNGELNLSSAVNPLTMGQEYAQDYNETGYHAYAAASLSSLGLTSPSLENTGSMTISHNGTNYVGSLMSQDPPSSGVWESGKTYSDAGIPGVQLIASQSSGLVPLDGEFTVVTIENRDGVEIGNTTTETTDVTTINNSEYIAMQEELTAIRNTMENRSVMPGTGGGSSGPSLPEIPLWGYGIIGGVVAAGFIGVAVKRELN